MTLELHVDYLGKYPIRKITFITEEDTIIADILENTITYTIKGEKIDLGENRNDYQKEEIKYFFKLINSETKNINDIREKRKEICIRNNDCIKKLMFIYRKELT